MLAAALFSLAVFLIGAYLIIASAAELSAIAVGVGVLSIAILAAIGAVAMQQPTRSPGAR